MPSDGCRPPCNSNWSPPSESMCSIFPQYSSMVVMKCRSVWCGLQWKLQKRHPATHTLVVFTLRSICHVTTSGSATLSRRIASASKASSGSGASLYRRNASSSVSISPPRALRHISFNAPVTFPSFSDGVPCSWPVFGGCMSPLPPPAPAWRIRSRACGGAGRHP